MRPHSVFIFFVIAFTILAACARKKTDKELNDATKASGLVFYRGKDTLYNPAGGSPHGTFKLKFNATAAAALGPDGKLPANSTFPEGSVIVKEIYANGALDLFAIMKKDSKSKFAAKRWVWGEYKPSGSTVYSVSKSGEACVQCHEGGTPRDLTRSFDLH